MKIIGLTLQRKMFGVTIVLFFFCCWLVNMYKKANELIRKQQRPTQSMHGMLEVFMINFLLMIFKEWSATDFAENLLAREKFK